MDLKSNLLESDKILIGENSLAFGPSSELHTELDKWDWKFRI